jgi:predicted RNA-binding protein with PIN domain
MHIMIDGYNLLRYITKKQSTQREKEQLLGRLRRYARYMEHAIVIIFDGGDAIRPYQESHGAVTIWYSGLQATADDLIIAQLPAYNADSVVLISDDRNLNEYAQTLDIILEINPVLDALLHNNNVSSAYTKDVSQPEVHKKRAAKDSKIERRLQSILRKL